VATAAWHRPLLVVHLGAGAGLIGAALALVCLGFAGAAGADALTVYPAAHLIEAAVIVPLALVALGSGLLLVRLGRWRLRRNLWLIVKLVVTVALAVVAVLVLEPGLARLADAARDGTSLSNGQRLRVAVFPGIALLLLVLNAVLAVYKPARWRAGDGGQTGPDASRAARAVR
jgi:uncharacterized membrane protein